MKDKQPDELLDIQAKPQGLKSYMNLHSTAGFQFFLAFSAITF